MILRFYFLLLSAFALHSCQSPEEKLPPPNIVWITSEDNSKHYLKLFDENGVATPNIEKLAESGLVFTRAFSNGPVCSVARSTLISGCYSPRIGAQYHRKLTSVPMPDSLKMFPFYLREAGYYTTNKSKKDYNVIEHKGVWDESSKKASWRKRAHKQPFFHVYNIGISHEYSLHFSEKDMNSKPTQTKAEAFKIQPNHPDTRLFQYTNAYYRDRIVQMDKQVGKVMEELEKDGLLDSTFVFYFGDHGGVLPGSKGYLYETGLHVPLVVHVPAAYKHLANIGENGTVDGFVSFVDFGATVLSLAGIETPSKMDGKAFLGSEVTKEQVGTRKTTYGYADRFDEKYDMVRSIRVGKYKYIRNFQPFNFDGLMNNYRYKQLAYQEWKNLYQRGGLNNVQSAFFESREPELLFDIEADPFETVNLAKNAEFSSTLLDLRSELNSWIKGMPDLSLYPEFHLIDEAFDQPTTFGKNHEHNISRYIDVADLSLQPFEDISEQLASSLKSDDPWERYWALIVCSTFGRDAAIMDNTIMKVLNRDSELINKVRAAEYFGITGKHNPTETMLKCLYESKKAGEALLILNSITLMQSPQYGYKFNIDSNKLDKSVIQDKEVKNRLKFLGSA